MSFRITDDCINCGVCEAECPNEAITSGADTYVINPERCTECVGFHDTQQCASVCPVDSCVPDTERVETREGLLEKVRALHPGVAFTA